MVWATVCDYFHNAANARFISFHGRRWSMMEKAFSTATLTLLYLTLVYVLTVRLGSGINTCGLHNITEYLPTLSNNHGTTLGSEGGSDPII